MNSKYFIEFWKLAKLALPLVLAQLAQNATSLVDTIMVGKLGPDALAGIAIGGTVFMFVSVVASGCVLGVGSVVSQAVGASDQGTCGRSVRQGFWLAVALFVPALILFWNIYPILIWLDQPPETAAASSAYLRAISFGLLPSLWSFSIRGLLEGHSDNRPIMIVAIISVILNVILNDLLMFGLFGLPELGLVGTGVASSIVLSVTFAMFMAYSLRRYPHLNLLSGLRTPDFDMLMQLIRVGGPIGLTLACEVSMFSAAGIAMGQLGKVPLAAHQIALQMGSFSFMVPLGISIAASARIGQFIGAKNGQAAKTAGTVGLAVCAFVMAVIAAVFVVFNHSIVGIFLDLSDPENLPVIELARQLLMIAALFQIVDGVQVSGSLALRGLKDTLAGFWITVFSYSVVGCGCGWWLCFRAGLGASGLWYGMTLGLATAAMLLVARFYWRVGLELGKPEPPPSPRL